MNSPQPVIPRPEYPRPQSRRETWLNLNGQWSFAEDPERSGIADCWFKKTGFAETITVPFCRESTLSGIERDNQVPCVWYHRTLDIPAEWAGQRILLHFGAADYSTRIWVDGSPVGVEHRGGHSSFSFDLSSAVQAGGKYDLTIRCEDDPMVSKPHGKQRRYDKSSSVCYVQTTGIWQTVWLEPVPPTYLARPRITPSVDQGGFLLEQRISHLLNAHSVHAKLYAGKELVSEGKVSVISESSATIWLGLSAENVKLWEPANPFLYHLEIALLDEAGNPVDKLVSYAGLRSVAIRGNRILLNGRSVFQRLVLDQGYYPDGLLTAPSDEALVQDIELSMAHGFNGARFHQKVFEERALYHADRLGYLVWGEFPDWGPEFQRDDPKSIDARWIEEWLEVVERDYSHPCLIGWCPLNEQEGQNPAHLGQLEIVQRSLVLATKLADRTRPVLDSSGWIHRCPESDLYDDHDYEQDPAKLAQKYADLSGFSNTSKGANDNTLAANGRPFFVSEMGGMRWIEDEATSNDEDWGYGRPPRSKESYIERFTRHCEVLLKNAGCFGYCITQLTDVFQEKNGLLTFDRKAKFETAKIRAAQSPRAAIENSNTP